MTRLSLRLLGSFQATLDDRPIDGFESNKVRALLAYLAVEASRPHSRDALAGLLWPDLPNVTARNNLRQALANLRASIGDRTSQQPVLNITRETVQLNAGSDLWLDVSSFTSLLAACEQHAHRHLHACKSCVQRRAQAIDLYHGDFLAELFLDDSTAFEEWMLLQREHLRRQALETLYALAETHARRGAHDLAYRYAARQLQIDTWREEAHRQAMQALALSGRRSEALMQYETCSRILFDELGVEPSRETEALYQLIKSDMLNAAPSILVARHNLPAATTPFVGRTEELAQLGDLLENPDCRLLTLVGPGGAGKTRLALQAASAQLGAFEHGIYFVPLAPLNSPEGIITAIATGVGLTFSGQRDPQQQLLEYLGEKELLLILDNFEHLLEGADLITDILHTAARVVVLVTSRERLDMQSEWIFEVGGLPYPQVDSREPLDHYSAVSLFVQHAQSRRANFALTELDAQAVTRICRTVEGMPLAIELAASSTRALSYTEIASAIEQSLTVLTTTWRDIPERHRSMRAVFDHSWQLLSIEEQRVLMQLAVFRGGFRLDAAENIAGATLSILTTLVDKSLIKHSIEHDADAVERYDVHELVRQYADQWLIESGATHSTRDRHLEFFLRLAENAEPKLQSAEQVVWLERLEREHDNLRAAMDWAQQIGSIETGLWLAGRLSRFWFAHGYLSEGRARLSGLLAQSASGGDQTQTTTFLQAKAKALQGMGVLAWKMGDYAAARACYEEGLPIVRTLGDQRATAQLLGNMAIIAANLGEYERSVSLYAECREIFEALGEKRGVGTILYNSALVLKRQGKIAAARPLLEESLSIRRELGDRVGVAVVLNALGDMVRRLGDLEAGHAIAAESLRIRNELGDKLGVIESLDVLAGMFLARSKPTRAVQLVAAATKLRQTFEGHITPSDLAEHEQFIADLRAPLDEAAFERAWAEGQTMSLEQAIEHALRE